MIGDDILVYLAKKLVLALKKKGVAFRWGGDEFVMITDSITKNDVETILYKIDEEHIFFTNSTKVRFHVSCGVDVINENNSLNSAIARADKKMYEEKRKNFRF